MSEKLSDTTRRNMAPVMAALALAAGVAGEAKAQPDHAHGRTTIEATRYDPTAVKEDLFEKLDKNKIHFRVLNLALSFTRDLDKPSLYYVPTPKNRPYTSANPGDARFDKMSFVAAYPEIFEYNGQTYLMAYDYVNHRKLVHNNPTAPWDLQNTFFINTKHPPKDLKIWTPKNSPLGNKISVPAHVERGDYSTVVVPGMVSDQIGAALAFRTRGEAEKMVSQWAKPSKLHSLDSIK